MAADILAILIKTNLAAAAAIVVVLAFRRMTRRAFGARIAYALWLAVPLAVGASLAPARVVVLPYVAPLPPLADVAGSHMPMATVAPPAAPSPLIDNAAVIALWLAGAAVSFAFLAWSQSRFIKSLGGVAREGQYLRATAWGAGPAVVGALFPRIVLPADFETRYEPTEQKVVLAHEAAHLAAGDAVVNALVALAQCLCWFNPLVHLAARVLRVDQELACDAAVLSAYPQMRRPYAEALLKTQIAAAPLPLGCYWPAGASNPLKERIDMLKLQPPSRARRLLGGGAVVALCLGGAAATWAAQPVTVTLEPASVAAPGAAIAAAPQANPTPAGVQTAQAAPLPRPAVTTATPAAAPTVVGTTRSAAGNTYQRIDAAQVSTGSYSLTVTMPDGRQRPVVMPRMIPMLLPREETEAYRAAKRVYEAAREEHAARMALGQQPQPWTPELQSAVETLDAFARDLISKRTADQAAYYKTITVSADEAGVPVAASPGVAAAWPRTATYMVPRNFTTEAKARVLASLDKRIADAPPRTRDLLLKVREVVEQEPTTN
jgi:beta-lactamase regulating signal transducer with metallopeptidase domain